MGLFIQKDGNNNISVDKLKKAKINTKMIINKLKEMKVGPFYMKALSIFREFIFLSSLCYGTEVLYNVSLKDVSALSNTEDTFLKEAFDLDQSSSSCLLLLELGLEPVDVKIIKKRAFYLKYIVDHEDDLIGKVFMEQMKNPLKGDWYLFIIKDLEELKIESSLVGIKRISKKQWKDLVNEKCRDLALAKLLKKEHC